MNVQFFGHENKANKYYQINIFIFTYFNKDYILYQEFSSSPVKCEIMKYVRRVLLLFEEVDLIFNYQAKHFTHFHQKKIN